MEKTIYFHIGGRKTGTTALQKFLSINREPLKNKDYLYPGFPNEVHHEITHQVLNNTISEIKTNGVIRKYTEEIRRSGCKNIIISAEGLESLKDKVPVLKAAFPQDYAVKIIFYIRRQDERLESNYNQSVKEITVRSPFKFSQYSKHGIHPLLDYYNVLLPWREAFGRENIIVRCYEKEQYQGGSIFHDFLNAVGLTLDDCFTIPQGNINPSLKWDLIEVIRYCNITFKDDVNFHRDLVNYLEKVNLDYHEKMQYLLSPQQRRNFLESFTESNAKVAREYLGREDGRLFYAPLPDLNELWKPYEGLTIEKIVPIFTRMIINIERNRQK